MSSGDDAGGGAMGIVRTIVPNFVRRSFALKFLIVLLVMGLAIGSVGAVATGEIEDQTRDRIQSEYSGLALQEANLMDQWVERNRLSTRLASSDVTLGTQDGSSLSNTLSVRMQNDLPSDAVAVHVVVEDGDKWTFAGSTSYAADADVSNTAQSWVADVETDDVGEVVTSSAYRENGQPVIGFLSPITGTDDRYLVMEVSVSEIADQMQGSDRADGGFTQVVNESGSVLIDERVSEPGGSSQVLQAYGEGSSQQPIEDALALTDQPSGVASEMDANPSVIDEQYAVGYAPVNIPNQQSRWVVLVHAPTSELFGFAQTVSDWGLIATGVSVLTMLLIGAVLGYNTSQSIDRLTGKAEEMEEGNLDVEISSGRIDSIGRLYDGFAEMRDALREQIDEAERARKEAEVSRAEALEMSNYLQEKAEEYSEIMQACSRGDLTRRMEADGENDAMDQIAEDFNEMIGELEMTTGQLKTFAEEVEEGGRSVQQSAETVRDASEQVADSVQKISDDAYDQKERLQRISEEMDAVADQLEQLETQSPNVDFGESLDRIQEVAGMIEQAADLGEQTMAESENVAGAAEEQAAELNEVTARAEELTRYAEYLGDGLNNFETEEEHEFVFQTGAGSAGPAGGGLAPSDDSPDDAPEDE